MKIVELKDIRKTYIEKSGISTEALCGINLSFETGEFAAIAGPSGSGKTTILNIIGALDKPTSGSIIIDQTDITSAPIQSLADFRLNKIGFVFQSYNLFNTLTALENVEYVMLLKNLPHADRQKRAYDVLGRVGLEQYSKKRPNQLSGGQQQRVAVARALASNPKIILADEPTANLDSKTAQSLIEFMHELNRQYKITFIFSTHDKMVMDKADRVINIRDGKLL